MKISIGAFLELSNFGFLIDFEVWNLKVATKFREIFDNSHQIVPTISFDGVVLKKWIELLLNVQKDMESVWKCLSFFRISFVSSTMIIEDKQLKNWIDFFNEIVKYVKDLFRKNYDADFGIDFIKQESEEEN